MTDPVDNVEPNVRSSRYYIVQSRTRCPQCEVLTPVFTFAVPTGYESRYADDDTPDDESGTWEVQDMAAVLMYIEYVPDRVADHVRELTPDYRLAKENEGDATFWINHCTHCGAQQFEEDLHEFEGPFGPNPVEGPESVEIHRIHEPFEAKVGGESSDTRPMDS